MLILSHYSVFKGFLKRLFVKKIIFTLKILYMSKKC